MNVLTACSFTIVTEITLRWLHSYARLFPHGVDFRHAEFRVQAEEQTTSLNTQVVLTPVPQVLQVLVVDCRERIRANNKSRSRKGYSRLIQIMKRFPFSFFMYENIQARFVIIVIRRRFFATWWQCLALTVVEIT